jgi:hypothetical protein
MKIYPRSSWTARNPMPFREYHPQLPYFLSKPEVEFCVPDNNKLYLYLPPTESIQALLNEVTNLGDVNYNYVLPANEFGAYTVRGSLNRCEGSDKLRVLLLLGNEEDPSDVLKTNQQDFLSAEHILEAPGTIVMEPTPPTSSVQVFDLTEYLGQLGYYQGPNTGVFTDHLSDAINEFQLFNNLPVTGLWDRLTVTTVLRVSFRPQRRAAVGSSV